MRVRMLVQMSGTRDGQDWPPPGAVLDLPEAEAHQLVTHRNAAAVEHEDAPDLEAEPENTGPDDQDGPETEPDDDQDEAVDEGTGARRRGRPRLPRDAEGNIVRG
ncbi:hypothetical protein [Streptomyces rubellomurinus]|uniref:Uncharacterized protein n=1 Tax=Streptomyces rubellomurinus (strain ATCC 31215) TaxID=359131 RepID=A0A0F2TEC8_STRR3|nr:hypothetical protein [Streptomyces rubellomurinus]KJS60660.1 hypothetical protein VM95_19765 [Streptomyces rubellomurinus]